MSSAGRITELGLGRWSPCFSESEAVSHGTVDVARNGEKEKKQSEDNVVILCGSLLLAAMFSSVLATGDRSSLALHNAKRDLQTVDGEHTIEMEISLFISFRCQFIIRQDLQYRTECSGTGDISYIRVTVQSIGSESFFASPEALSGTRSPS